MSAPRSHRRRFLETSLRGLGATVLGGALWSRWIRAESRAATAVVRPPGARPEDEFLARCIKCGQCVQACPYDTLRLADLGDDVPAGTPFFEPRRVPCYLCGDLPCVGACPSGALDPGLSDPAASRMGLAVLTDHENCLSYNGLRCEICFRECPLTGRAITIKTEERGSSKHALFLPQVHSEACTGCGVCEKACPLEEAAIKVLPFELAQGKIGDHYEFGWKDAERPGFDAPVDQGDERSSPLDYLNSNPLDEEAP